MVLQDLATIGGGGSGIRVNYMCNLKTHICLRVCACM
jgi:hypothetical protein